MYKKGKVSQAQTFIALFLDCGCHVTSYFKLLYLDFLVMMDCITQLGAEINPFTLKLLLLGNLSQWQTGCLTQQAMHKRLPCTRIFITVVQALREVEMEVVWKAEKKNVREKVSERMIRGWLRQLALVGIFL